MKLFSLLYLNSYQRHSTQQAWQQWPFKNYKLICVIISDFFYDSLDISSPMLKSLNHLADFKTYKALRFYTLSFKHAEFTEHLWILKSLFKKKHRVSPHQLSAEF